jgi:hypothetical protein
LEKEVLEHLCAMPHTLQYTRIALDMAVQRGGVTALSISPKKNA